jgi:DnaK suppressor protein
MLSESLLQELKSLLELRLAELESLEESTRESRRPVELDQQSLGRLTRMDAMQQQAMALATEQRRHAAAQRIRAALRRMEEDEYGDCLRCGEEIALARLRLDPATALCVPSLEGGGER